MPNFFDLPHEKVFAYQEARKLVASVQDAGISDSSLRRQAVRAAISTCLNIAEGCGRAGSADKARVYAIARGECCEAAAALDMALMAGACSREEPARAGAAHARAVYALISGLIRRFS